MSDRIGLATDWLPPEGIAAFQKVFPSAVVVGDRVFAAITMGSDAEVVADMWVRVDEVVTLCPDLRCTVVIARASPGDFLAFKIADGFAELVGGQT